MAVSAEGKNKKMTILSINNFIQTTIDYFWLILLSNPKDNSTYNTPYLNLPKGVFVVFIPIFLR